MQIENFIEHEPLNFIPAHSSHNHIDTHINTHINTHTNTHTNTHIDTHTNTHTNTKSQILCANCGVLIISNSVNLCLNCIKNDIDISYGIPKQATIHFCKGCDRYLSPPNIWITAELESRELLGLCLKKLRGWF